MLLPDSRNVLLCLRYGIGDVTMELPVLEALRGALPRARITALVNPPAHELLEGDARVDELVVTSRWGLRHLWDRADEDTRARIGAWLQERRFDLALDAEKAAVAVAETISTAAIPVLESSSEAEREAVQEGRSGVEAIRAGVRAGWGLEVPATSVPELAPGVEHRARARTLLDHLGLQEARPVAIAPVASTELKAWPVARFAAVADHVAEAGGRVLILEGPQEDRGSAIQQSMRRPEAAARVGAQHLLTTAALLGRCRALVCNDTGLMHVAVAAGTPTVAVFGPTREDVYAPEGSRVAALGPQGLECRYRETRSLRPPECWYRGRCLIADHSCVQRVAVEDVLAALEGVLSDVPAAARVRIGRDPGHRSCVPDRTDSRTHAPGP